MQEMMFDAPIPGQSLTNSPDNPYPFERPPEFVDLQKATDYLFEKLMDKDLSADVIDLIADGVPISILATATVFRGFAEGKWTPDLMLLLLEPTMYILLFMAEQAGVDYVLEGPMDDAMNIDPKMAMKAESKLTQAMRATTEKVGKSDMPANLESLLGRGEM